MEPYLNKQSEKGTVKDMHGRRVFCGANRIRMIGNIKEVGSYEMIVTIMGKGYGSEIFRCQWGGEEVRSSHGFLYQTFAFPFYQSLCLPVISSI